MILFSNTTSTVNRSIYSYSVTRFVFFFLFFFSNVSHLVVRCVCMSAPGDSTIRRCGVLIGSTHTHTHTFTLSLLVVVCWGRCHRDTTTTTVDGVATAAGDGPTNGRPTSLWF
jgi:hypothetical protein